MHYKFGGSTADRTIACPAWHNLSINMPGGPASLAAIEGTMMHLLFERGVTDEEFEPAEILGESRIIEGKKLTVTDTHIDKVYTALEELDQLIDDLELDEVVPEVMMNTDDETGGTADIVGWAVTSRKVVSRFLVADLKTGDGHMVQAENNKQLLFYVWQAVEKYKADLKFTDDTKFFLSIIQPSERRDQYTDTWEVSLKDIMTFARAYKQAQKEAKSGITTPCAGSHCAYCPAASTCPAKTGLIAAAKRIPKGSTELKSLIEAMNMVDEVEDWCRSVRKCAHEQAEAGVKLPGWKMVAKRATRQWNDESVVADIFKRARSFRIEDYMDMKLKSAPQMEKVCKAKNVDFEKYTDYISLQSSGTTLVKDTDKRPAVLALPALADMAKQLK